MLRSSRPANSRCRAAIRPPTASSPKSASPNATCRARLVRQGVGAIRPVRARISVSISWILTFLGYRVALGLDVFGKQQLPTNYISYSTTTVGFGARLGFALREDLVLQVRYSLYRQAVSLPDYLNDCILALPLAGFSNGAPINGRASELPLDPCFLNGEASLAVRRELATAAPSWGC